MTEDYETLRVGANAGVTTVTFARPERRNALNRRMHDELLAVLDDVAETDARVLVISGDERAFCAGMDLVEAQDPGTVTATAPADPAANTFRRLETAAIPTIAAIEGHCLGAGLELAICCDLRVASATASLGLPEVSVGIPPAGAIARLARLVGPARAKELVLTGEPIDADQARSWGLVTRVCAAGEALAAARRLAEHLAALAPLAVRAGKWLVDTTERMPIDEAVALEFEQAASVLASEDAREGMRAFVERRRPEFRGR